jgi:SAM-dependent methyltransferase
MEYDGIKSRIDRFIANDKYMRRLFYILLDVLILRQWYVKKNIRRFYSDAKNFYDAGSGFCQYSDFVLSHYIETKVFATDVKIDFLKNYHKSLPPEQQSRFTYLELDLADPERLPKISTDFIICIDTLEHIEDDVQVLKNFFNNLNFGGYLLLSTPSDSSEDAKFATEHVRSGYALADLITKVKNAGFEVVEYEYSYGIWGQIYWILVMKVSITLLNLSKFFMLILPFYLLIVLVPSLICMSIDFYRENSSGNGLLLVAKKT